MKTIQCPAIRPKTIKGKFKPDAKCGRKFFSIDDKINQYIILQCPTCRTIWQVDVVGGKAFLQTLKKGTIDFGEEMPVKVESYQLNI